MDVAKTIRFDIERSGDRQISVGSDLATSDDSPRRLSNELINDLDEWARTFKSRIRVQSKTTQFGAAYEDRAIGTELFKLLFPTPELRGIIWYLCRDRNRITVFDVKNLDPTLDNWPWEACAHVDWSYFKLSEPGGKIAIVRSPVAFQQKWNVNKEPVNVFVPGFDPLGSPAPNYSKELDAIKEGLIRGLGAAAEGQRFKIESLPGADILAIGSSLRKTPAQIVHIIGHGGRAIIQGESASEEPLPISGDDLVQVLANAGDSLSVVILTSCLTMQAAPNEWGIPNIGQVLAENVPYAVGMRYPITDKYAVDFTKELYYALSYGSTVLEAFVHARDYSLKIHPGSPEWVGPTIYQGTSSLYARIFPSSDIPPFLQRVIDKLYENILAIRGDERNIDAYHSVRALINEIDTALIDRYHDKPGDFSPVRAGLIREIKEMRTEIRESLNTASAIINGEGSNSVDENRAYFKISARLLDILPEFKVLIQKMLDTYK